MDHHLHVSELNADCLTLDDRLTEGYTVASTSDGHFEHALRNTEVRSSNVNTRYSEGVHSNLHAFATLAEHQFWLEFNVGELQTGVAGTTAAHHMRHWYEFETRLVHWYKEGRQTIVALLVRVSYADYVRELRAVSVGDEPLFTIEDPLALFFVPYSGGVKVSTSAARLLGESEVGEDGLVLEERHILLFDFWLTEVVKDAPVQVRCIVHMHTHTRRTTRELFLYLKDFLLIEAPSTVLYRERETINVVLNVGLVELLGERVGYLDLLLPFSVRTFDHFAYLFEVLLKLLVGNGCIRIHKPS